MVPSSGIFDGAATPDTSRAVEIEEAASSGAHAVFDGEVRVYLQRLRPSEETRRGVEMSPASLNHGDGGIVEFPDQHHEKVRLWDEVCVEYSNQLT